MVLNVHRNHKGLLGTGRRGEGGMEVEVEGRMYTYRYTVTTRMTFALRWAAIRAILMFDNCEGQSHKTVSTDHNFWSGERRAEADSNRGPSAYQSNALPLGQTGSRDRQTCRTVQMVPRKLISQTHNWCPERKQPTGNLNCHCKYS